MATLVLTAVGTLVGGPVGGAIGALAGRQLDGALLGGRHRDGPRIKELSITTSSYGQAIPRFHGRMRSGGTILWATELTEHKEKSGGKKGQPSTTSFSYSSSFAVALSSRPIKGIGRIWADGNLLRGAGGDLKVPGAMRVYTGHGDQAPDPLIAASEGAACPAFRSCAYVVFEDLALGDFGNRIPALSFEIFADDGGVSLSQIAGTIAGAFEGDNTSLEALDGFAVEGGPMSSTLATIETLYPLSYDCGARGFTIARAVGAPDPAAPILPPAARAWADEDFGIDDGERRARQTSADARPDAMRYYDVARDFQPGVQRPAGGPARGRGRTIEFPGALAADAARSLAEAAARRSGWGRDRMQWRIVELDPTFSPGSDVRVLGKPGIWRIEGWEWRSRGIELDLKRRTPLSSAQMTGDSGSIPLPADTATGPTILSVFEVPPASTSAGEPTVLAAAASAAAGWSGAALYLDRAGELVPIGNTGRTAATMGKLAAPLAGSAATHFEPSASLLVALEGAGGSFAPATLAAIAQGANQLRVGGEIIQFACAELAGDYTWRLSGLLRGRGGTEPEAMAGHAGNTTVVLLDEGLVALDPAAVPSDPETVVAAIGLGDPDAVNAGLANAGLGRRPLCPVHPRITGSIEDGLALAWTRRARGAWVWLDEVETPLVEQLELYRVGLGPVALPFAQWQTNDPHLVLSAETLGPLAFAYPDATLWVRQIGNFAQSQALHLTTLS